jgi:hypothetical protein
VPVATAGAALGVGDPVVGPALDDALGCGLVAQPAIRPPPSSTNAESIPQIRPNRMSGPFAWEQDAGGPLRLGRMVCGARVVNAGGEGERAGPLS